MSMNVPAGHGAPGASPIRREYDIGSISGMVPKIPELGLSLAIVLSLIYFGFLVGGLALALLALLIVCGWLVSGLVANLPLAQGLLARGYFHFRAPTPLELRHVSAAVGEVCRQAQIDPSEFSLWIDPHDHANACAAGGRLIAVTPAGLTWPPEHLRAVLAHEIGHHLHGHSNASLLVSWYSLPGTCLIKCLTCVVPHAARVAGTGARTGLLVTLGLLFVLSSLFPPLLLIPLSPATGVLSAYLARRAEFAADRNAVRLGYGQDLIAVFTNMYDEGEDALREGLPWFTRLKASHPSFADRIAAMQQLLVLQAQAGTGVSRKPSASPRSNGVQATAVPVQVGRFAPGWHPDFNQPGCLRYWDGTAWTAHVIPRSGRA